ncbi:MAG: methyltransferase domain-containing protein [Victivallaceae bacterium]|nr:methyltransferase domain-containing protein [Victivallaceae bacterium]
MTATESRERGLEDRILVPCGLDILSPSKGAELDLGCGSGGYTAELATRHPEREVLAADVMIGRLRKLAARCERQKLGNVRILRVEARLLVGRLLPDQSLKRIHLLCPDPWPKDRHRGHRLLCSDFTAQLHRVLEQDGIFHFSSDDDAYCDAVNLVMSESGLFEPVNPETALSDLDGVMSDFERRWLESGLAVRHRTWRRLPLPPHTIGH